jgi:hypothetical protein
LSPTASAALARLGFIADLTSLLQILVGSIERLLDRRRIALDATVQSHRHHRARIHVDGVFLLVGEVRAAVLHLGDLRVWVVRIYPVLVRALLLPLTVDARQILSRRRRNPRRFREVRKKRLVAAKIVAAHDRSQRCVGFQRRRIDTERLSLQQIILAQQTEHPREDFLMCLFVDQSSRPRDCRVIRWCRLRRQPEKIAQAQRVCQPPGDPAFAVDALEIAHQQCSKVVPGRESRSAHHRMIKT